MNGPTAPFQIPESSLCKHMEIAQYDHLELERYSRTAHTYAKQQRFDGTLVFLQDWSWSSSLCQLQAVTWCQARILSLSKG